MMEIGNRKSMGSLGKYTSKMFLRKNTEYNLDEALNANTKANSATSPSSAPVSPRTSTDKGGKVYPTEATAYKLVECVGRGTEGTVWRAICLPLKTEVAVKIVDLEAIPTEALDEIRQQIAVMQLCNRHPNIVDYHTSFIESHHLWVVMSYLAGGSCLDIMKYGFPYGLDEAAIRVILKGILKALAFFHKNGRIHRDIKAGNVLISDKGHVQVADFGVSACLAEQQQLRTTLCGTPCWMAPEVMLLAWRNGAEPTKGYGCGVDIWSLGITALELARGRPPFSEYPPSKVFSMIVQHPPPTLSTNDGILPTSATLSPNTRKKFSKNFQDMIGCCLQKDPAKRPSAEKLLKHKFFSKKADRNYLVNNILTKLPPLGERVRMCQPPANKPVSECDELESKFVWEFPEETEDTERRERIELERMLLRSGRSLQSMSSSASLASASFMSSASSMASNGSWINVDVGSVEFLNHIFHECDDDKY